MRIIHQAAELKPGPQKVCVAIGVFDGVHLGHQQVIRQTITDAEQQEALAVVITFDRHPSHVVAPERVPPLIYTLSQKLHTIAKLGADVTWLIHFDEAFSKQTGEGFIRRLNQNFGQIHSICVGGNFTFGSKRSGNVALLQKFGQELNFKVHGLAAVSLDGQIVSSTRIRESIRSGQLDLASQMLGRGYSLAGPVIHGDELGGKLGFPTANIATQGLVVPLNGVYAAHAHVAEKTHRAVLNIGYRPTLNNPAPQLRVEAHLLDFSADIYGQEMEITFVKKLREEEKFSSLDALKNQIARDLAAARILFGEKTGA